MYYLKSAKTNRLPLLPGQWEETPWKGTDGWQMARPTYRLDGLVFPLVCQKCVYWLA